MPITNNITYISTTPQYLESSGDVCRIVRSYRCNKGFYSWVHTDKVGGSQTTERLSGVVFSTEKLPWVVLEMSCISFLIRFFLGFLLHIRGTSLDAPSLALLSSSSASASAGGGATAAVDGYTTIIAISSNTNRFCNVSTDRHFVRLCTSIY